MKTKSTVSAPSQTSAAAIQPIAERYPALENEEVTLSYCAPAAEEVCVAGTFNNWSADSAPLKPARDGNWSIQLNLKAGRYEYRFVVDGEWQDDPGAAESVPNPYGGRNAVLKIGLDKRVSLL